VLPFDEMNISLGDKRFYFNEKTGQTWIPEQEYKAGSWGYVGGQVYVIKGSTRTGYGATKDILGTEDEPIFQTQRTGIQQFRFDVPSGKYDIIFHFSELVSPERERNLAYNLGNTAQAEEFKERSFTVMVNGKEVVSGLNNLESLKPLHAVSIKYSININDENGLTIDFKPITGEAILNGIQLRKIY
jgi:beta-galactosidase